VKKGVLRGLIPAVVILALIGWCIIKDSEPSYHGKPLRQWLRGFDFGPGSHRRTEAQIAIHQLGTNSLPVLIHYLRYRDPPLKTRLDQFIRDHSLWSGPVEDAFVWNRRAAVACAELGPVAASAIGTLTEAAIVSQAPEQAMDALGKMLPKSANALTNLLITGNSLSRSKAAEILVAAFSYPELVMPSLRALTNALVSSDFTDQINVISALSHSRTQYDLILPAFLRTLSDLIIHPSVRYLAAKALGDSRTQSDMVVPALIQAFDDPDSTVRVAAVTSLAQLEAATRNPDAIIPPLLSALADPDDSVRYAAVAGLGHVGAAMKNPEVIVPALVKALNDPLETVRWGAANSLGQVGVSSQLTMDELRRVVQEDVSRSVRDAALRALEHLDSSDQP
jgi:HEAT repeat protein